VRVLPFLLGTIEVALQLHGFFLQAFKLLLAQFALLLHGGVVEAALLQTALQFGNFCQQQFQFMQALLGGRQFRDGIVFGNVGMFGGAAQRAGFAFVQMLALVFQ
jgi:hypothetical protein